MVINGEAGMQIMGDWAKGEFLKAGKVPGTDFVCIRFPGTQGAVTFNSDQFAMFNVSGEPASWPPRPPWPRPSMSPTFQSAFNVVKGSVPARTDVPNDAFDDCGKKGMADLAEANTNGTLFGSMAHGHAAPAAVKNATYDVITAALQRRICRWRRRRRRAGRCRRRRAVIRTEGGGRRPPPAPNSLRAGICQKSHENFPRPGGREVGRHRCAPQRRFPHAPAGLAAKARPGADPSP
jgi:hypothetical protein